MDKQSEELLGVINTANDALMKKHYEKWFREQEKVMDRIHHLATDPLGTPGVHITDGARLVQIKHLIEDMRRERHA